MELRHKFMTIRSKNHYLINILVKIDAFSLYIDDNINGGTNLPQKRELKDHFSQNN